MRIYWRASEEELLEFDVAQTSAGRILEQLACVMNISRRRQPARLRG